MAITQLNGKDLRDMFLGGLSRLKLNESRIDELNVFPVPDGDTGTNMCKTLADGAKAVAELESDDLSAMMQKFSRGMLLGARGNSGVILSQFVKGMEKGLEGKETATCREFAEAFGTGVSKAYEAVITPTEGTMLTVMREGYEFLISREFEGFEEMFAQLNKRMEESLENTPELLPVLKEAGVIDSGGAGLLCIFQGMEDVLNGAEVSADIAFEEKTAFTTGTFDAYSELEYGYCTEFILQLQHRKVDVEHFDIGQIIRYLETIGNSLVAVKDDDLVKIHVHTFTPGKVLNYCQNFGEFITLKIENMSIQHNETMIVKIPEEKERAAHKKVAYVICVNGEGLDKYFRELGVDEVVDAGLTGNPSAEDFIAAYKKIDADTIIVLPCNSNIIMAAGQSAEIYGDADVRVVGAKSIAEGYAAISIIDMNNENPDAIISDMEYAIRNADTGLITRATRDVDYENISVKEGHFIGLSGKKVLSDSPDKLTAVQELLKAMDGIEDKEVLTVFYGMHVTDDELADLRRILGREFSWMEYGFIYGGQEVYDFIFAVE